MLHKRVISGILFLPVFYLVTWELPPVYFVALVTVTVIMGQYEFYRMVKARGANPHAVLGIVIGALLILESYYPVFRDSEKFFMAASVMLIMVVRLFSRRPVAGAIEDTAHTLLGVFYVAVLFMFQIMIRMGQDGKQWLVFLYFIIWASDIGAYAIGIPFGKHRLYEKVSPKKSIEGFVGAIVLSAGMALICRVWFMQGISFGVAEAVGIALLLTVVGTVGDLAESLLKRASGVKDSGGIIPGHGGILDRMDSMLFAAPVMYYYLQMR
jgi:phosphatidate cytidylyltransferase